jgi:NAD(P)-dependent dehydrogenase (short-subunit alcohol dehydrogenase family)
MALKNLSGRCVLVTGAASGIGRETALAFAREDARVLAVDVDETGLSGTAAAINAIGGECRCFGCDVSDMGTVTALAANVAAEFGPPDVIVNNAGIGFLGAFLDTPLSAWNRVLAVNLMGTVHVSRAFLPAMIAAGGARHVVNVASAAGIHAVPNLSAYSASKHAVVGISDALAMELQQTAVSVTLVCPGIIDTPIVRNRQAVAPSVPDAALEKLDRVYRAKGAPPSLVGARIVRAVKRGEDLVLVGPSAAAVFHARRFSRRLLRAASITGARRLGYVS